jgi:flagellar M-ring protein FliF
MDDNQPVRSTTDAAAGGLEGALRAMWARASLAAAGLSPVQRLWGGLALAAGLAAAAGLLWYAARPDYRTLYAGLEPGDAREVGASLAAAGLPFELSADGAAIKVPAEDLDKARLLTTAKGGPKSGRMGFEIFDKPNWIGSEFDERVNYQRALEGELEHTIDSMGAVESSRVALTMPHDSLFTDQQRAAKASVVLKLRRRELSGEEADSIRNLVASAVDDLSPDKVVLADADGHLVLGARSETAEAEAHEAELAEKLVETLEPVAGAGNVRASVNVDYDTSSSEETDEIYDPSSVVTLTMQKSQQTAAPGAAAPAAKGVPGTVSNAPQPAPPLFPTAAAGGQSSSQESGTYGASKRTKRLEQGTGRVRRITAAVVVNDRMAAPAGKSGAAAWKPRDAEEMKRLTLLAEGAVGYDAARGDQITVENISFDDNRPRPAPGLPERLLAGAGQSQALLKYGTILAAMLGLIFFVIRPIAVGSRPAARPELAAGAAKGGAKGKEGAAKGKEAALPPVSGEDLAIEAQKKRAQSLHDGVIESINADPGLSARLLHSWIRAE